MYLFRSGSVQGCPRSGVLFAGALDPFLIERSAAFPRAAAGLVRACADDVSAVLKPKGGLLCLRRQFDMAQLGAGCC